MKSSSSMLIEYDMQNKLRIRCGHLVFVINMTCYVNVQKLFCLMLYLSFAAQSHSVRASIIILFWLAYLQKRLSSLLIE
jgi:hypothetical protein